MVLYGIPNCDTTKKAMDWLKKKKISFEFHNYKELGISAKKLKEWCDNTGWEKVLNKRSTTWRELTAKQQQSVVNAESAIEIMEKNNSIIKRPIIAHNNELIIGFDEKKYAELFLINNH